MSHRLIYRAKKSVNETYMKNPVKNLEPIVELQKLLKPLHGLSESGNSWELTFHKHLQTEMHMKTCISDPTSFYKANNQ